MSYRRPTQKQDNLHRDSTEAASKGYSRKLQGYAYPVAANSQRYLTAPSGTVYPRHRVCRNPQMQSRDIDRRTPVQNEHEYHRERQSEHRGLALISILEHLGMSAFCWMRHESSLSSHAASRAVASVEGMPRSLKGKGLSRQSASSSPNS
jgi:hypothetical protein